MVKYAKYGNLNFKYNLALLRDKFLYNLAMFLTVI